MPLPLLALGALGGLGYLGYNALTAPTQEEVNREYAKNTRALASDGGKRLIQATGKPRTAPAHVLKQQQKTSGPNAGDMLAYNSVAAIGSGIQAYINSRGQRYTYEAQASAARGAYQDAVLQEANAKQNLYSVAQNYEYQAMLQGLQNAQVMASARNRTSHSGVRMGVGSAREMEQTRKLSAKMDYYATQRNKDDAMNDARWRIVDAQMAQNNALAQEQAAYALRDAQSPWLSALGSAVSAFSMADLRWQAEGFGSPTYNYFFS